MHIYLMKRIEFPAFFGSDIPGSNDMRSMNETQMLYKYHNINKPHMNFLAITHNQYSKIYMNIHALQFLKPERPPLFSDGLSAPLISSWDFLPICRKIIYHSTLECHTKKVRKCKEDGHHPDELSCLAKVACVQRTRQKSPRKENWIRL